MNREREDIFQDSVSIGYGSRRAWVCACGRTEGYELVAGQAVLERYPNEGLTTRYIIRDWELEHDWRMPDWATRQSECLNPDCEHFCRRHDGIEGLYPVENIKREIQAGKIFTMPLKGNEVDLCMN